MTRLCTLADAGHITEANVRGEITRLEADRLRKYLARTLVRCQDKKQQTRRPHAKPRDA